jgi:hypothetical protein
VSCQVKSAVVWFFVGFAGTRRIGWNGVFLKKCLHWLCKQCNVVTEKEIET